MNDATAVWVNMKNLYLYVSGIITVTQNWNSSAGWTWDKNSVTRVGLFILLWRTFLGFFCNPWSNEE